MSSLSPLNRKIPWISSATHKQDAFVTVSTDSKRVMQRRRVGHCPTIGFNVIDDLPHDIRYLVLDAIAPQDLLERHAKDLNVMLLLLRRCFNYFDCFGGAAQTSSSAITKAARSQRDGCCSYVVGLLCDFLRSSRLWYQGRCLPFFSLRFYDR